MADSSKAQLRRKKVVWYLLAAIIVALVVSLATVPIWNMLYASGSMMFVVLLVISLAISVVSNVFATRLTLAGVKQLGIRIELNPITRWVYGRFGPPSMYITALVGIPLAYLLFLALYVLVHVEILSFALTFFPLVLSYDALNDYVVTKRRRRGGQVLQS